jgi:hypothetical protein
LEDVENTSKKSLSIPLFQRGMKEEDGRRKNAIGSNEERT